MSHEFPFHACLSGLGIQSCLSSNKYYTLKTKQILENQIYGKDQNLTFKYFLQKNIVLSPPVYFEKITRKI